MGTMGQYGQAVHRFKAGSNPSARPDLSRYHTCITVRPNGDLYESMRPGGLIKGNQGHPSWVAGYTLDAYAHSKLCVPIQSWVCPHKS